MQDFDSTYRTEYDSYFNANINFNSPRKLIEFETSYGKSIGVIVGVNSVGNYNVIVILPIYQNGESTEVDKDDITNYITKAGWNKIDKYIKKYSEAKQKYIDGITLTDYDKKLLGSNTNSEAYNRFRSKIKSNSKVIRKSIKKVIRKKCKCK